MTWEELDALVDSLHFTVENRGVRVPPVGGLIGSDPAALELLGRLKTKLDESW